MRSGGAVNNYVSGIIASALELGLQQEYLDSLIAILKVFIYFVIKFYTKKMDILSKFP